jgi:hypothetical protein
MGALVDDYDLIAKAFRAGRGVVGIDEQGLELLEAEVHYIRSMSKQ